MSKSGLVGLAIAIPLLLAAGRPAEALTEYRVQVQTSIGSGTGVEIVQAAGALNETEVSLFQTNLGGSATSEAFSSLSTTGYVPTLRVRPTNAGTRAQAVAWGVQGYTNTSGADFSTTLSMNLTADVTGGNDLEARIYLFVEEDFEFSFDPGTMLFECSCSLFPGFDFRDFELLYGNLTGAVDETRSFDLTLAPGESFYVWARLLGTADAPGQVDAWSTLTASFSDTSGLTPAATAVPEPALAALLASGLLLALRAGRPGDGR